MLSVEAWTTIRYLAAQGMGIRAICRELSKKFAPDGEYIPRTYFLGSDGVLDPELKAPRDRFVYFYDENNPASVLAGMEAAQKKLK